MTDHEPAAGLFPSKCSLARPAGHADRSLPHATQPAKDGGRPHAPTAKFLVSGLAAKIPVSTDAELLGMLPRDAFLPTEESYLRRPQVLTWRSEASGAPAAVSEQALPVVGCVTGRGVATLSAAQEIMLCVLDRRAHTISGPQRVDTTVLRCDDRLSLQQLMNAHVHLSTVRKAGSL